MGDVQGEGVARPQGSERLIGGGGATGAGHGLIPTVPPLPAQ